MHIVSLVFIPVLGWDIRHLSENLVFQWGSFEVWIFNPKWYIHGEMMAESWELPTALPQFLEATDTHKSII